jgi:hypothetical protein
VRWFGPTVAMCLVLVGCADPPPPRNAGAANEVSDRAEVAEIVCEADGSTTVRTSKVVVQPDGVHVHVESHLDQPASVGEFAMDVEPGETDFVSTVAPGRIDAACYPYSEHGPDGDEPKIAPIEVFDPEGIFVHAEVECSGPSSALIADFFEEPLDVGPVPLDVARTSIRGLRPDDELVYTGYPEQEDRSVAVRRDGTIVAIYSFVTFDGEEWSVVSNSICESADLR